MNKLFFTTLFVALLFSLASACTMMDGLSSDYHESNASMTTLPVSPEKMDSAIEKALPKAGYSASQTKSTPDKGVYSGLTVKVSYEAYRIEGEKNVKLYVRVGVAGDREEEKIIIAAIRKELGLP